MTRSLLFRERLLRAEVVEVAELEALDHAVEKIVANAVCFAEESPEPDPATLTQFVYADPMTVH